MTTGYDDTLDSFADLKKNWDSYGADPIDQDLLEAVKVFADALYSGQGTFVPMRNGGIQCEVHKDGYDIEIEFTKLDDGSDDECGLVYMARFNAAHTPNA